MMTINQEFHFWKKVRFVALENTAVKLNLVETYDRIRGGNIAGPIYSRICRNRRNFLPKTYAIWKKTSRDIGAQYKVGSQYCRMCQYRRNFLAKN